MSNNPTSSQAASTGALEHVKRIKANASRIWGGKPEAYGLEFETDDYEHFSCILGEFIDEIPPYEPSYFKIQLMTLGHYTSEKWAVRALDKNLQDIVNDQPPYSAVDYLGPELVKQLDAKLQERDGRQSSAGEDKA